MHVADETARRSLVREIAVKSGLIFAFLMAISAGIAAGLYWNERRVQTAVLESSQRQYVDGLGNEIVADLQAIASDVLILSEGKTLAALLDVENPRTRANLADEFRLFADRKGFYDQIRYIDAQGREVVRVNLRGGAAEVVPEAELQSKRDRYYFEQAMALDRGDIYISPFDLNVENGRIEQPPKPTIRFATPVHDAGGNSRGVLVVNYLGQQVLDRIARSAGGQPGEIMLLNAEGFWLKSPRPEQEWAFMYDDSRRTSFAAQHPGAWEAIGQRENGQLHTPAGLFTFATVRPVSPSREAVVAEPAPGYHWKLVSQVSPAALAAQSSRVLWGILGLLGGTSVLLAAVSWLLGRSLVQQREARRRLVEQERLAAIGGAMTALAHESRNALQRSQAGLELLARRVSASDDSRELIAEVQEAQYHLRDLYEQARDWAVPLNPQREDVDIAELAGDVWQQLSHQRNTRQDELDIEPALEKLPCRVDRRMFAQVLRNIFENSLAATERVRIQVSCDATDKQHGEALRIRITDNGPGLSEEQARRMFEPFYTTRTRGTGLGMAISRRIVEAHGGTISAHSRNGSPPQSGTEIVIDLPRGTA